MQSVINELFTKCERKRKTTNPVGDAICWSGHSAHNRVTIKIYGAEERNLCVESDALTFNVKMRLHSIVSLGGCVCARCMQKINHLKSKQIKLIQHCMFSESWHDVVGDHLAHLMLYTTLTCILSHKHFYNEFIFIAVARFFQHPLSTHILFAHIWRHEKNEKKKWFSREWVPNKQHQFTWTFISIRVCFFIIIHLASPLIYIRVNVLPP